MYKKIGKYLTNCSSLFPSASSFYTEKRITSKELQDNGSVLVRSSLELVPKSEIRAELLRIRPEDYTLENLLKAGVSLEQVNIDGLLSSSDPIEIDSQNEPMVEKAYEDLLKHDAHIEYERIANELKNKLTENSGNYNKTE